MTSPFVKLVAGALVRAFLIWAFAKFGASVSDDQIVKLTAEIVPVLLVVGWSVYQKYTSQQRLVTAQAAPRKVSEVQLDALIADGRAPSVFIEKDEVPL